MRNFELGYCTNVHAGADLETTRANLERYALAVKARVSPGRPMGVGLWLSAAAVRKLLDDRGAGELAGWLRDVGLVPFTLNGFPHGDFHQPVVKHRVYEPTWWEAARLSYTLDLIEILHALLPAGRAGSISTLPIAWGTPSRARLEESAGQLLTAAGRLAQLERDTGRLITLCLEPEPGCVLQRSADVVRFFEEYLLPTGPEQVVRRYLRLCHDICHAAVMFEEQEAVLRAYRSAGIEVGKVQVSSAVRLSLDDMPGEKRSLALAQLASFAEDRYLHQTLVQSEPGTAPAFYEDLPLALGARGEPRGEWRVHFHVPIYLERFGHLFSSRDDIGKCLAACRHLTDVRHYEVETYAWGVLPAELRQPDLAAGIAEEMRWFQGMLAAA